MREAAIQEDARVANVRATRIQTTLRAKAARMQVLQSVRREPRRSRVMRE